MGRRISDLSEGEDIRNLEKCRVSTAISWFNPSLNEAKSSNFSWKKFDIVPGIDFWESEDEKLSCMLKRLYFVGRELLRRTDVPANDLLLWKLKPLSSLT